MCTEFSEQVILQIAIFSPPNFLRLFSVFSLTCFLNLTSYEGLKTKISVFFTKTGFVHNTILIYFLCVQDVMRKYKASVAAVSTDQITIQDQQSTIQV